MRMYACISTVTMIPKYCFILLHEPERFSFLISSQIPSVYLVWISFRYSHSSEYEVIALWFKFTFLY